MKKIFLASLLVGGMSCTFPSFVQAAGVNVPPPQPQPQPQPVFSTRAASEASRSLPYPPGAGGGAGLCSLPEEGHLSLALAMSRQDSQEPTRQENADAEAVVAPKSDLRAKNYEKMRCLLLKNHFDAENFFIKERLSQILSHQSPEAFDPKEAFRRFIRSLMDQTIDHPELLNLPSSLCQFPLQDFDNQFDVMVSSARDAPRSLGFTIESPTFKNCFFESVLKLFLKEYSKTFLTSTYGFSLGRKVFKKLQSFAVQVRSPHNRHPLDPLTKKIFPNLFGFFIWDDGFDRSDSRTWRQNNRTADEVKDIFLSWFSSPGEMPRARESLTQNFVQKKDDDRTQEDGRISSETLDGFRFASLSSGVRVDGGKAHYYPSVGLRLKTQAPYLNFMNELLDFVEALPNPGMITLVKTKILQVFEDQMTLDGLCIPGFVQRLLNSVFELETCGFTDDQVRQAFAVARITRPTRCLAPLPVALAASEAASVYVPLLTDLEKTLQRWTPVGSRFPMDSFTQCHASDFFSNPCNITEISLLDVLLGAYKWNQSSFLEASIAQEVQNLFSFEEVSSASERPEETVARIITDQNFRDRSLDMSSWSIKKTNFQKMILWTDNLPSSEQELLLLRINNLAEDYGRNCSDSVLTGWNAIELEILQKRSGLSERNFLLTLIYTNFHEGLESHLAQFDFREMIETSLQIKHLLNSEAKIPFFKPVIGNYFSNYYLDDAIRAAGVRGAGLQPNGILTALWQRFSNPLAFIMTQAANEANQSVLGGLETIQEYRELYSSFTDNNPVFPESHVFAGKSMSQQYFMYQYALLKLLEKYRFIQRVS